MTMLAKVLNDDGGLSNVEKKTKAALLQLLRYEPRSKRKSGRTKQI